MLGIGLGVTGRRTTAFAPRFTDDFAGADAALETRSGWTLASGTAGTARTLSGGLASNTSNATGSAYYAPDFGSLNHYLEMQSSQTLTTLALMAIRFADVNNFVGVRRSTGGSVLFVSRIAGTITTLYTAASSPGASFRIEAIGTLFRLLTLTDGQWVETFSTTLTTPALQTSTRTGFNPRSVIDASASFDNFATGPL